MYQRCDIQYCDKNVGTAEIYKEGLYYRFECRCKFPVEGIHRLYAIGVEKKVPLGVCVPIGNRFGISTRIPVCSIGTGDICVITETKEERDVLPVNQNRPFHKIEELDNAVLFENGIWIK